MIQDDNERLAELFFAKSRVIVQSPKVTPHR